jgi:2-dehydro-3-deoxyphosphogluconate aldolase/(4S)-4-hydroxy-2-oxoglutarate aldolase
VTSRWPPTSEPAERLLDSLRHQPLLVVLRPRTPIEAAPRLERLRDLGLRHVEIAWNQHPDWSEQCQELARRFPTLALGAASVCEEAGVKASAAAGFRYVVSPVLERSLLEAAARLDLALVPGVMTPSEVHRARSWGCGMVKLFPAATLGPGYWSRLRGPLGEPFPFCIAAGGIGPSEVLGWLEAGVDAVALGSSLGEDLETLAALLVELGDRI